VWCRRGGVTAGSRWSRPHCSRAAARPRPWVAPFRPSAPAALRSVNCVTAVVRQRPHLPHRCRRGASCQASSGHEDSIGPTWRQVKASTTRWRRRSDAPSSALLPARTRHPPVRQQAECANDLQRRGLTGLGPLQQAPGQDSTNHAEEGATRQQQRRSRRRRQRRRRPARRRPTGAMPAAYKKSGAGTESLGTGTRRCLSWSRWRLNGSCLLGPRGRQRPRSCRRAGT
jgi:hypothetical protein